VQIIDLHAQVFQTQEQALAETFARADTVIRKTLFLDQAQVDTLEKRCKCKLASQIIPYYTAQKGKKTLGVAFFDTQIVRTKEAVVMIVVSPPGVLEKIKVLAFYEPLDYLPIPKWFSLFEQKSLTQALWPGKQIHTVTGATLSVRVFTFSARRALVLYEMIGVENK
jgi:hypothetical protein